MTSLFIIIFKNKFSNSPLRNICISHSYYSYYSLIVLLLLNSRPSLACSSLIRKALRICISYGRCRDTLQKLSQSPARDKIAMAWLVPILSATPGVCDTTLTSTSKGLGQVKMMEERSSSDVDQRQCRYIQVLTSRPFLTLPLPTKPHSLRPLPVYYYALKDMLPKVK